MAYNISELGGDFQKGYCLYKLTTFNGHLSTCEHITDLRDKSRQKLACQLLAVVFWWSYGLAMKTANLVNYVYVYSSTVHSLCT